MLANNISSRSYVAASNSTYYRHKMGNHTSSLRDTISAAFDAAAADSNNKQTIGLEKLISLPLPSTSFSVDRSHLGVLFVLDRLAV